MNVALAISGEVGKLEAFAAHTSYAMKNSPQNAESARTTFYNSSFGKTMINSINSGRATVESLYRNAAPKNSELSSMYSSLNTLKSRYVSYYNYILNPTGNASQFESNCSSYYTGFTGALSLLNFNKFITSSYTTANMNTAYATSMRGAANDIKSAVSSLSMLRSNLVSLGSRFENSAESTLQGNANTYISAASYAMRVNAYRIMLSGSDSNYSSYYSNITFASTTLLNSVKSYASIGDDSLDSYSATSNNAINNATNCANSIISAVGN